MKLFEEQEKELDNFLAQAEVITGKNYHEVEIGGSQSNTKGRLLSNVIKADDAAALDQYDDEDLLQRQNNNFSITTSSSYKPAYALTNKGAQDDQDQ